VEPAARARRQGPAGEEDPVAIAWRKDVDAALQEARKAGKHLLVDFNAAPL
jgi:hypothetical protein